MVSPLDLLLGGAQGGGHGGDNVQGGRGLRVVVVVETTVKTRVAVGLSL